MKRVLGFTVAGLIGTAGGWLAWTYWLAPAPPPAPVPSATPRAAVVDDEPAPHREPAYIPKKEAPKAEPSQVVDRQWADKNRAAIQALEAGQLVEAVELFEACHAAVPDETVFTGNLAEALARLSNTEIDRGGKDDAQHALEHLRRAHELAPEREDLKRRLEQLERLAQSEKGLWTDTSEHFVLAYDGERSDLLWKSWQLTGALESAYQDLGEHFGRWPVENGRPRIKVVLYRREGFHDATGIAHWAGGLYDGTIRVPVEDLGREKTELERVLRHELVHAFVAEAGGRDVPGWLNEGVAQWLEQNDLGRHQAQITGVRRELSGRTLLALAELKQSLASLKDEAKIHLAYQQSLAFVDHLERNYGERVLYAMIEGCKTGATVDATFKQATRTDLAAALADLAHELE